MPILCQKYGCKLKVIDPLSEREYRFPQTEALVVGYEILDVSEEKLKPFSSEVRQTSKVK